MTIGKANRTLGVNRALGSLGYDAGFWLQRRKSSQKNLANKSQTSPENRFRRSTSPMIFKTPYGKNLPETYSPKKSLHNNLEMAINPLEYHLRIKQCLAIIKLILVYFHGEHFEVFFIEEFFADNRIVNKYNDSVDLGSFWAEMVDVFGRLKRKGIELDPIVLDTDTLYTSPSRRIQSLQKSKSNRGFVPDTEYEPQITSHINSRLNESKNVGTKNPHFD